MKKTHQSTSRSPTLNFNLKPMQLQADAFRRTLAAGYDKVKLLSTKVFRRKLLTKLRKLKRNEEGDEKRYRI